MLIAIDPGADAGWAVFDERLRLVSCGLGAPHTEGLAVRKAIIEKPMIYPGGKQKARPADIITLAVRAGESGGLLRSAGVDVQYVEPFRWKGSVPKDVCHARIWGKLTDVERGIVDSAGKGIAPSKRHNILDAVGIGLFGVGR
jgi:hypothetical protein